VLPAADAGRDLTTPSAFRDGGLQALHTTLSLAQSASSPSHHHMYGDGLPLKQKGSHKEGVFIFTKERCDSAC
jgi:hypothetical protein